jgi:hypothetical protein
MISLKSAVSEWDRLESLFNASRRSYQSTLQAIGDYAVDIDHDSHQRHQLAVANLLQQLEKAEGAQEILGIASGLKEELKSYQCKTRECFQNLCTELRSTASALQIMVDSLGQADSDPEEHLKTSLKKMKELASSEEVKRVCPELQSVVLGLESSVDGVLESKRVVEAQMRDEISTLHHSLDKVTTIPSSPNVRSREELETIIRDDLKEGKQVTAILLLLRNWKYLESKLSSEGYGRFIGELGNSLEAAALDGARVGRWADNDFLQITDLPKGEVDKPARAWSAGIAKPYLFVDNDEAISLNLRFRTAVILSKAGMSDIDFIEECDAFCDWGALRTGVSGFSYRID